MTRVSDEDEFLLAVARQIGSERVAEIAIDERDRRRAAGENVVLLWDRDKGKLSLEARPADAVKALAP